MILDSLQNKLEQEKALNNSVFKINFLNHSNPKYCNTLFTFDGISYMIDDRGFLTI